MKKLMALVICVTLLLSVSACGSTENKETEKAALKAGTYTLQIAENEQEKDILENFTITIYEDGTFQHYETPISSYIGMGHYSIEGDVLTLKEDMDGCTGNVNYFRIEDGQLLFMDENSANYLFVPLEDGAAFIWDVPQRISTENTVSMF